MDRSLFLILAVLIVQSYSIPVFGPEPYMGPDKEIKPTKEEDTTHPSKDLTNAFPSRSSSFDDLEIGPIIQHEDHSNDSKDVVPKSKRQTDEEGFTDGTDGILGFFRNIESIIKPLMSLLEPLIKLFQASAGNGGEEQQ